MCRSLDSSWIYNSIYSVEHPGDSKIMFAIVSAQFVDHFVNVKDMRNEKICVQGKKN